MKARSISATTRRTLAAALLLSSWTSPVVSANEVAELYEDALVRAQQGDCPGAIIQLKSALQLDPSNLPGRVLLGKCQVEEGDPVAAEQTLRAARQAGADEAVLALPLAQAYLGQREYELVISEISETSVTDIETRYEILLSLGRAELGLQQHESALTYFRTAAELAPHNEGAYVGQARTFMELGKLAEAAELIERGLGANANSADVWTAAGELARRQRDPALAITHFGRALEVDEAATEPRMTRAALLLDSGNLEAALEDIELLRQRFPSHPQAAWLHALALDKQGNRVDSEAALIIAETSVESVPDEDLARYPTTLLLRGLISFRRGNLEAALSSLRRYLDFDPSHIETIRLLGLTHLGKGDLEQAINVLEPTMTWRDPSLLGTLGDAYMRAGRFADAERTFTAQLEVAPADPIARMKLAQTWFNMGKQGVAMEELESLYADDSANLEAGYSLATMQLRSGMSKRSLETIDRLLAAGFTNAPVHDLRGQAYVHVGELDSAKEAFTTALEVDGGYKSALLNWARVERSQGNVGVAETLFTEMWDSQDWPVESALGLVALARESGNLDEARNWLDKANSVVAEDDLAMLTIARTYSELGEAEVACQLGRKAERTWPEDARVLEFVGQCELTQGNTDAAKRAFASMARFAKGSAQVLHRAGENQYRMGDLDAARLSWNSALQYHPDHVFVMRDLALLEGMSGNTERAMALASQIEGLDQGSYLASMVRADVHAYAGRISEAEQEYFNAHSIRATQSSAIGLYRSRWRQGQHNNALAALMSWLEENPDSKQARTALAMSYITLGQPFLAIEQHERLLESDPENVTLVNNLALLYFQTGHSSALETAQRAYELDPTHWGALDTLGWILVQRGEPDKGLRFLRDARSRASHNPEIAYHLAVALHGLGRSDEAVAFLELAVSTSGTYDGMDEAQRLLAELSADQSIQD